MNIRSKIRLFVDSPLGEGQSILLDRDQANYLFNVMRLNIGDFVSIFNGKKVNGKLKFYKLANEKEY